MSHSSHECDSIALICMDYRLWEPNRLAVFTFLQRVAGAAGVKDLDVVALAGGAKNILDGQEAQAIVLNQIGLSVKLHAIKSVILTNYLDCGAYGEDGNNREKLIADLRLGEAIVKRQFPELAVTMILIDLKEGIGQWETLCEVIN